MTYLWLRGLWPIPEFPDISRDEKVQELPASLIASELSAHQIAPGGVIAHSSPHKVLWSVPPTL